MKIIPLPGRRPAAARFPRGSASTNSPRAACPYSLFLRQRKLRLGTMRGKEFRCRGGKEIHAQRPETLLRPLRSFEEALLTCASIRRHAETIRRSAAPRSLRRHSTLDFGPRAGRACRQHVEVVDGQLAPLLLALVWFLHCSAFTRGRCLLKSQKSSSSGLRRPREEG